MLHDLGRIAPGLVNTILLTVLAFTVGGVLAIPIVWLRRSRHAVVRGFMRSTVDIVRSVPPITWLFLIYFGLPEAHITLAPFPAALVGLSLIAAAFLSEAYRAGLLAIHKGQWEAAHAVGLNGIDVSMRIIAPQAVRVVIPPAATYAIGLLKDTAVASTIGVSEITFRAGNYAQTSTHPLRVFGLAALLYIALSLPLAYVSRGMDRRLRTRFSLA